MSMDTRVAETLNRDLGFVYEQVQKAKGHLTYGSAAWNALDLAEGRLQGAMIYVGVSRGQAGVDRPSLPRR